MWGSNQCFLFIVKTSTPSECIYQLNHSNNRVLYVWIYIYILYLTLMVMGSKCSCWCSYWDFSIVLWHVVCICIITITFSKNKNLGKEQLIQQTSVYYTWCQPWAGKSTTTTDSWGQPVTTQSVPGLYYAPLYFLSHRNNVNTTLH